MSRRRSLSAPPLLACALFAAACSRAASAPERHVALLHAITTSGEPLPGARFWADGRELGTTTARGLLRAQLEGREGASVELTAACPPAFRTLTPRRRLVLRRVRGAATARALEIELSIRCEPIERSAALVVLTSGAGAARLPILVDGEVLGQTEADGSAHLLLSAPPRSLLRVELDTSHAPQLLPHDPVQTFRLQDESSILLVEQAFARAPPPRLGRRRMPAEPGPRRPQRIE